MKKTLESIVVIGGTLALFRISIDHAQAFRGYTAYGGECFVPLIIPIYYIAKKEIKNFLKSLKKGIDR